MYKKSTLNNKRRGNIVDRQGSLPRKNEHGAKRRTAAASLRVNTGKGQNTLAPEYTHKLKVITPPLRCRWRLCWNSSKARLPWEPCPWWVSIVFVSRGGRWCRHHPSSEVARQEKWKAWVRGSRATKRTARRRPNAYRKFRWGGAGGVGIARYRLQLGCYFGRGWLGGEGGE